MKIHIRGHTGEKPYRCDYCSYASTCRGNLKVHQERHHKEEIVKHGLNAGIKGPNDYPAIETNQSNSISEAAEPEFLEDEEPEMERKPASMLPTSLPMPTQPSTMTSSASAFPIGGLRVPPFGSGLPNFPQLSGVHGVGSMPFSGLGALGGLPNPQMFNPNLLAGLLKSKTENQTPPPHFPLNFNSAPPSANDEAVASVTEISEDQKMDQTE